MKKIIFASLLSFFCLTSKALAQNTSTTQMSLANSLTFQNRIVYLTNEYVSTVFAEAKATVCHTARLSLASQIVNNPLSVAANIAPMVSSSNVGGAVIVGTVVSNTNPALVDSSASDLAIKTAIINMFNALARCETGS